MFGNLKFLWKFIVLSALIPLTALIIAVIGLVSIGSFQAEYDNLYDFMLVPIFNLEEARANLTSLSTDLSLLAGLPMSGSAREEVANRVSANDAALAAVMERYDTEWVSTLSPDFSRAIVRQGKGSLQQEEAAALQDYQSAAAAYADNRDALLSGKAAGGGDAQASLDQMKESINRLLAVNMGFAEVSRASANETIRSMRMEIVAAGVVLTIIGMIIAALMTTAVVRPLNGLIGIATRMAQGDLYRGLPESERARLTGLKDEIGEMARALNSARLYQTEMAASANAIAFGDLTVQVMPKCAEDELGQAFSQMIARLREMVGEITASASGLAAASEQLSQAAAQAGDATNQIAGTIQQVAKGTAQQSESVSQTAASMHTMNRAINGVASGAQQQAQAVENTAQLTAKISTAVRQVAASAQAGEAGSERATQVATGGAQAVAASAAGMNQIKSKVALSAGKVRELGSQSEQIGSIVDLIDEIASQTNLLALNAAIEAARAGAGGRGFAVVADEVRKLAERASSATRDIGALIHSMQTIIADTVKAMNDGTSEVEAGVIQAEQSARALAGVMEAVESVRGQVSEIASAASQMDAVSGELLRASQAVSAVVDENTNATRQMNATALEVSGAVDSIASISEENSAAIEEVSAAAEEMSAQVEEVTASAHSLADMAAALQQVVAQFRLDGEQQQPHGRTLTPRRLAAGHPPMLGAEKNARGGSSVLEWQPERATAD